MSASCRGTQTSNEREERKQRFSLTIDSSAYFTKSSCQGLVGRYCDSMTFSPVPSDALQDIQREER